MPPHPWTSENIRKIVEEWGKVISLEMKTVSVQSFSVARILVETSYFPLIQGWMLLSIHSKGYQSLSKKLGVKSRELKIGATIVLIGNQIQKMNFQGKMIKKCLSIVLVGIFRWHLLVKSLKTDDML